VGSEADRDGRSSQGPRERLAAAGEFAAEIAHELRNLLVVISASAYVARHATGRGDAATALPHVVKIEHQARKAQAIVEDIMALARGELPQPETVRLRDVIAAARADVTEGAATWRDELDPDLELRAHPGLLVRLLAVLYENAIAASAPRPPSVVTRAARSSRGLVLSVADDGPGVPPGLAERIFEALVTGRPGGTGLGLALARRIVEAHGGTLALEPQSGPGATFRVELPEPPEPA
jgi:signal transduction histidine kinase